MNKHCPGLANVREDALKNRFKYILYEKMLMCIKSKNNVIVLRLEI